MIDSFQKQNRQQQTNKFKKNSRKNYLNEYSIEWDKLLVIRKQNLYQIFANYSVIMSLH